MSDRGFAVRGRARGGVIGPRGMERREAEVTDGGRRQPASGAMPMMKGDVLGRRLLKECKETGRRSFSVSLRLLGKLEDDAAVEGKIPMLVVQFDKAEQGRRARWALVPAEVFDGL